MRPNIINRFPEFNIHLTGQPSPSSSILKPYRQQIQANLKRLGIAKQQGLDIKESMQTLQGRKLEFPVAQRSHYWMSQDVDVMDGDGKASLDELVLYAYRLDQLGNKDGTVQESELKLGLGLCFKGYLYEEAQKCGLQQTELDKVHQLLAQDQFVASSHDIINGLLVDLTGEDKTPLAKAYQLIQAARNWDDMLTLVQAQAPAGIQQAKEFVMGLFAQTANMTRLEFKALRKYDLKRYYITQQTMSREPANPEHPKRKAFQLSLMNGPVQFISQWLSSQVEMRPEPITPDHITVKRFVVREPEDYNLQLEDTKPWLDQMVNNLTENLLKHQNALIAFYNELESAIDHPEQFNTLIQPLGRLIQTTWPMCVKKGPLLSFKDVESELGAYLPDMKEIHMYQKTLRELREELSRQDLSKHELAKALFCRVINNLVHEHFHAYQFQVIGNSADPDTTTSSAEKQRIVDYQENYTVRGLGSNPEFPDWMISRILTGDIERYYRQTPLEIDARYMGEQVAQLAYQIVARQLGLPSEESLDQQKEA